ncbi:MAG: hypothetical protein AAGD38_02960 [Acidobacteriota bacterium]
MKHGTALALLGSLLALVSAVGASAPEYEATGSVAASDYLPSAMMQGTDWTVAADAINDGFDNTYRVESRFGTFEARGRAEVEIRIREIAALAQLEEVSRSEVFLDAVERSITAPLELVADFLDKPAETVKGIPRGIGRWYKRTRFKVREFRDDAQDYLAERRDEDVEGDATESDEPAITQEEVEELAKKEGRKYLRISSAERRWYAQLQVDPSTDNEVLRQAVTRVARVDGLTSFGMTFVSLPEIPGSSEIGTAMDLVWKTDPLELVIRNRERMVAAGLDEDTARLYEDNPALSLTLQTAFLDLLGRLKGVEGRQHLFARALDVETRTQARKLVISTAFLVRLHEQGKQLDTCLPGSGVPVARSRGGELIAVATADGVRWTEAVAEAATRFGGLYADEQTRVRTFHIIGLASERFEVAAAGLGWHVQDGWRGDG